MVDNDDVTDGDDDEDDNDVGGFVGNEAIGCSVKAGSKLLDCLLSL